VTTHNDTNTKINKGQLSLLHWQAGGIDFIVIVKVTQSSKNNRFCLNKSLKW